MKGVTELGDTM
jgi:hypothetical protein